MNEMVDGTHKNQNLSEQEFDNKLLNETLAILIDSRDFYTQAEKLVEDDGLNRLFLQYATDRNKTCAHLTNLLVARDTQAYQSGTMSGELRKLYTEFMSLLNDESSRLLEQLIYHELRNKDLLADAMFRVKTDMVSLLLREIADAFNHSISTMQQRFTEIKNSKQMTNSNQDK